MVNSFYHLLGVEFKAALLWDWTVRSPHPVVRLCAAVLGAASLFAALLQAGAADLDVPENELFTTGENGFSLCRIPGMVVTTRGSVLVYCEARRDDRSDWGELEVHLRRSTDGGKTREASHQVAHFGERLPGDPHKARGARMHKPSITRWPLLRVAALNVVFNA